MEIISRARWGARHDDGFRDAPLPARELWLHHSVTIAPDLVWVDADGDGVEDDEERAMRTLEDIGEQRFGGGVSYTFAVMPSGRIYQGHSVHRQGAHTGGRNDIARAVVLVGDYSTRPPTDAQRRAVAWLVVHGHRQGWWTVAGLSGGHRQAPAQIATACPGDAALREIPAINQLAADYAAGRINLDQEDDMPLSDQDVRRISSAVMGEIIHMRHPDGGSHPVSFRGVAEYDDLRTHSTNAAVAALGRTLDAQSVVLRQIAEKDDRIELDAEDLAALQASVRAKLDEIAAEHQRQLEAQAAQLDERLDALANELEGRDAEGIRRGLREFFLPAVEDAADPAASA
ncbi:hypothetical protein SUDANB95_05530 [Actinosynnema sp. ALI-1.44]